MQFGRKGKTSKKNSITVYPNCFHAVRDLTNFEYGAWPKTIKHKRIRVSKIKSLASGLQEAWSTNQETLTCGRVEISLFRFDSDTDVLHLSKMIARSQLKRIQMIKVPVDDVIRNLDTVLQFPDVAGDDKVALSELDKRELAILCNLCGLWDWKFKKFLRKDLVQESSADEGPAPNLFSVFQDAQKEELLTWYVSKRYSKKETKFCFRTWDSKGGKVVRKKALAPKPNGSYLSAAEAVEAVLEWAVALQAWSPEHPYDPQMKWIEELGMLVRNRQPNHDR